MFRIILIVALILIAIPFFNKAKDYISEGSQKAKNSAETVKKAARYWHGDKK